MAYNIFVRINKHQVINTWYSNKKQAIKAFDELASKFKEVDLIKKRRPRGMR